MSTRDPPIAGTMPRIIDVAAAAAKANATTRASMPNVSQLAPPGLPSVPMNRSVPHCATSTPSAPPASASTALSVINCRTSRHRAAPIAARTASSCRRPLT